MTRAELESLGMTDEALEKLFRSNHSFRPDLSGEDTPGLQSKRRRVFDGYWTMAQASPSSAPGNRVGAFAIDNPKVHAESGNPKRD